MLEVFITGCIKIALAIALSFGCYYLIYLALRGILNM
jgi:hypothetical protein